MDTAKKKRLCSLILPAAVLLVRFGPALAGLNWRAPYRGVLNIVTAVVLVLWCVIWVALTHDTLRSFAMLPACILVFCLFSYQMCFPTCIEQLLSEDGQLIWYTEASAYVLEDGRLTPHEEAPVYIRENDDPGSLANVTYYKYVNEVFRGLLPDGDAFDRFF